MTLATRMYGHIPVGKGDDDGTIFTDLLKSSRFPTEARFGKFETLKEVLEKYKVSDLLLLLLRIDRLYAGSQFIPFSHKVNDNIFMSNLWLYASHS